MIILYAIFHLKNVSRKLVPSDIKNYGTPALSYGIKSTIIKLFFWNLRLFRGHSSNQFAVGNLPLWIWHDHKVIVAQSIATIADRQCLLKHILAVTMFVVLILLLQFTGRASQTIEPPTDLSSRSNDFVDATTRRKRIDSRLPISGKMTSSIMTNTTFIESERQHRQLQLFGGVIDRRCERLMDNTIENIFVQNECSCDPVGFPPALVVDCQRAKESCIIKRRFTSDPNDKLLCGNPGLRITLNVWSIIFAGSPVAAEICFYDASVFNVTLPDIFNPVCFGLFTGLPGSVPLANILSLIFGRTASTSKLLEDSSKSSSSGLQRSHPMTISDETCVPTIGDNKEKCNSCTICPPENGGGMIYDCSNIIPGLRTTECTVFPSFED